jgi:hypothetical protein
MECGFVTLGGEKRLENSNFREIEMVNIMTGAVSFDLSVRRTVEK